MALELMKETVSLNEPILALSSDVTAEGDIIVPDSKPDIGTVLKVCGKTEITEQEVSNGMLTIRGTAAFHILYRPEDAPDCAECMDVTFSFSGTLDDPAFSPDMTVLSDSRLISCNAHLVNSRKLSVSGTIMLDVQGFLPMTTELVSDIADEEAPPEFQTDTLHACNFALYRECHMELGDVLEVPGGNPSVESVLDMDARIDPQDVKIINNKIVYKGTVSLHCLYASADERSPITTMEHELPFTEILDVEGIREDMVNDIVPRIVSLDYSPTDSSESRAVEVRMTVMIRITAYELLDFPFVSDAYAPHQAVTCNTEAVTAEHLLAEREDRISKRETMSLSPSALPIQQVISCTADAVPESVMAENGKIQCRGSLQVHLLYRSEGENPLVCSEEQTLPWEETLDCPVATPESVCYCNLDVSHTAFTLLSSGELEIRAVMRSDMKIMERNRYSVLSDMTTMPETEPPERPSVIIYFAQGNETMWSIAKSYNISLSDLTAANGMEESTPITKGMNLLIPR